ncbi:hypothetical protein RYZ27_12895 [Hyphomonas sp. FCG-A18]|uniref:hypothetical protein n=1 Tax=Hyphomonas sp. FCG-A18 TaxID=3080019 RepID=UPI002B320B5F|nr:hypothetical protein RYZ27_12895 [Hyphomonas sp. FCG-A18]
MVKEVKGRRTKRALWVGGIVFILMTVLQIADNFFAFMPVDGTIRAGIFGGVSGLVASVIARWIVPVQLDVAKDFD